MAAVTVLDNNDSVSVNVQWSVAAPFSDRGSSVTAFRVKFKRTDGQTPQYLEIADCDDYATEMTESGTTAFCTVGLAQLTSAVGLASGDLIVAQVEA